MSETTNDDRMSLDRVVARVQKLLERGKDGRGATEQEAALAMQRAQELMSKYNLDLAQVVASGGPSDASASERVKEQKEGRAIWKWQRELAYWVASCNFCYHFISTTYKTVDVKQRDDSRSKADAEVTELICDLHDNGYSLRKIGEHLEDRGYTTPTGGSKWWPSSIQSILGEERRFGGKQRRIEVPAHVFVGRRHNVLAAQLMFDYLCEAVERACPYRGSTKSGYSWKEGCSDRLQERLYARKEQIIAEHEERVRAQRAAIAAERRRVALERQQERKQLGPRSPTAREVADGLAATAIDATGGPAAPDDAPERPAPAEGDVWTPGDGASAGPSPDDVDLSELDLEDPGTGLVLASQFDQNEADANYEKAWGMEPGTLAQRRAKAKERKEADEASKTPAERQRDAERQRKRGAKAKERAELARHREWATKDKTAYRAGADAGKDIGLDAQVKSRKDTPALPGKEA